MARIRTIKPDFWKDEKIMDCKPIERLLFIGLWNLVDDYGRLEVAPRTIRAEIFPEDDITATDVRDMLVSLNSRGLITIYTAEDREYFFVTNWDKHQRIDNKAKPKCPAPFGEIPSEEKQILGKNSEGSEKKCLEREREREEEKEKKEPRAVALGDWPADYREQFWSMWPNKVGKPAAMSKLEAVRKSGTTWAQLTAGLERYVRTKPPDRSWLNPATFLNQRRFEDEPAEIIPFRMPGNIDMDDICPPSIYRGAL
jgi:hypothetical protein